jgi:biotin transport system substrate-specific component
MFSKLLSREYPAWVVPTLRIAFFVALLLLTTQIRIPIPGTPVPITMQVLVVLLAGMALGPIQGASAVLAYLGLIAAGIDGRGMAAFAGPTAGYLVGFLLGALIAGLAFNQPERRKVWLDVGFGILAVAVIYLFGVGWRAVSSGSWQFAFITGAAPFIVVDLGKVLLAASLAKLGRESWLRWGVPFDPKQGN